MDDELIDQAIGVFSRRTGLSLTRGNDTVVRLEGGPEFSLIVRPSLVHSQVGTLLASVRDLEKPLLITTYVTPGLAEKLKSNGVFFLDLAGNVYLHHDRVLLYVVGQKPTSKLPVMRGRRITSPAGLKILFAILCKPGLEGAPYREIASHADVSHGSVQNLLESLDRSGHVFRDNTTRKIRDRRTLISRWADGYAETLRPALGVSAYECELHDTWWKDSGFMENVGAFVGGEAAADILTDYLRPECVVLYVDGKTKLRALASRARQRKGDQQNLILLDRFWAFQNQDDYPTTVAPALLVYAELLYSAQERNIDAAMRIREAYLE